MATLRGDPVQKLALDGLEVAYEIAGAGPPVVLIHGLGCSRAIWEDLRPGLEGSLQVLAYDLRGSGRTAASSTDGFSLATWAADLRATLAALGWKRPLLVGHSLGAAVALKYALTAPDGAAGLVLIATDARLSRLAPRMRAAAALIERIGLTAWVDDHWSKNPPFSGVSLARDPAMLDRYRALLLANDPEAYVRTCLAIASAEDLSAGLPTLTLPALVVVGGADDRTLPEEGAAVAASLADAELVEIEEAGHTLPFEAPAELAEAVVSFADRIGLVNEEVQG